MRKYQEAPKVLELTENAYRYYRSCVEGNRFVSFELARKKLTRNILLARKVPNLTVDASKQLYIYGHLQILVQSDKIVWVKDEPKRCRFSKDMKKFAKLNKMLDIPSEVNVTKSTKRR